MPSLVNSFGRMTHEDNTQPLIKALRYLSKARHLLQVKMAVFV